MVKKFLYKIWSMFLTQFGNIKVFRFPLFWVYDPDDYQVTGQKVHELMKMLKPGDVILRGYSHYLDGFFIPNSLKFSHASIYMGDGRIIHAIAEGVSETNLIEFTRCDRIAVFRPKKGMKKAMKKAQDFLDENTPYDFGYTKGESELYCFELCGECYNMLQIPTYEVKKFLGLVKRENTYLADSFFESPDFELIFQYNPKFNIDFNKFSEV